MPEFIPSQRIIVDEMEALLERSGGKINDETFAVGLETYDEVDWGPRFQLPMVAYIRNTPLPAEDCLRFRVWFKPPPGGDSRCLEYVTIKEVQVKIEELLNKGYLLEPIVVGVFWDNAAGCFGECLVKELVDTSG